MKVEFDVDKNGFGAVIIDGEKVDKCAGFDLRVRAGKETELRILYDFVNIEGAAAVPLDKNEYDVAEDANTLWNYMPASATINMETLYEHFRWSADRIEAAFAVLIKDMRVGRPYKSTDPDLYQRC